MSKPQIPIYATNNGTEAVFLFIAELLGYRSGTETGKIAFGKQAYVESKIHDLDYTANVTPDMTEEERLAEIDRAEKHRSEAHENIWLQRLYKDLDNIYGIEFTANIHKAKVIAGKLFDSVFTQPAPHKQWTVPIELDAGASMLQYVAALTNDMRLMLKTNMIGGDNLNDPWSCDGISRAMFKHAATPLLYGSSQEEYILWQDWEHEYTLEQIELFRKEITSGALGVAVGLKDFIINNVSPSEKMTVRIWGLDFEIECNRFRQEGFLTKDYFIYDTTDRLNLPVRHTTTRAVADLEQFRRYFVTLLIHHLDSRVADIVIGKYVEKYGTGIDIYDAFIVNPEGAADVRRWYAELIEEIHANRTQILTEYFTSIGINGSATKEWNDFKTKIVPFTGQFKCRRMALK